MVLKALRSDMTVMLGPGVEEGHSRPMTAQLEKKGHPVHLVFRSKDTELVTRWGSIGRRALRVKARPIRPDSRRNRAENDPRRSSASELSFRRRGRQVGRSCSSCASNRVRHRSG
jgi:hypothetical protein